MLDKRLRCSFLPPPLSSLVSGVFLLSNCLALFHFASSRILSFYSLYSFYFFSFFIFVSLVLVCFHSLASYCIFLSYSVLFLYFFPSLSVFIFYKNFQIFPFLFVPPLPTRLSVPLLLPFVLFGLLLGFSRHFHFSSYF